jgi:hypothetical protein
MILNFTVTSNHIHLLVYDGKVKIIPKSIQRDAKWTESIAVGDKEFVMEIKAKLGAKAIGRRGMKNVEGYELKERQSPYNRVFDLEKCSLRPKNEHLWHVF